VVIVAAGLSPAWQQILVFDEFVSGEVNRAREAYWCGSGKVLNAGLAISQLGADCCTLSPLGGAAREAIAAEFRSLGAPLRTIACREGTRVCTTILDQATSTTTELVENARPLSADEVAAYTAAFAEEAAQAKIVVLTGSLPAGVASSFYRELLDRTPGQAVLDVRGPELIAALTHRPLVVKPNREELGKTVGRELRGETDLVAAMRQLNDAGAQWVVVTAGKDAVLVTSIERAYRLIPPRVETVVNPIGCGDALAAGTAVAIERGADVIDAVRYGMAAAADRLRVVLPSRLDSTNVDQIARRIAAIEL
jgi:1-phosphofructokinase family hexose kinase